MDPEPSLAVISMVLAGLLGYLSWRINLTRARILRIAATQVRQASTSLHQLKAALQAPAAGQQQPAQLPELALESLHRPAAPAPAAIISANRPAGARYKITRDIHIEILPGLGIDANKTMVHTLRALVERDLGWPVVAPEERAWLSEDHLWRFLVARHFDVDAAKKQAIHALHWIRTRRPYAIRARDIAVEAETGKVCVRGKDRFGRPVIVMDSSRENTFDANGNMLLLAYVLERAIRMMESPVDKYVIVIRLGDTSMFNFSKLPGPTQTRETLKMLMTVFAERLGHGILYQPPAIFAVFLNLFAALMDAHVMSKAVWITGDTSPNTPNDACMVDLIGAHWRELVGEGQPVYDKRCPPGYNHAREWQRILDDDATAASTARAGAGGVPAPTM
jgi:hypothetical protein